ncbi:hypothetical protein [Limosilactobacillus sp.]|uniref:hypothetical protein n=1 Tax=Limosilactobacillus sp. TaxID=2773925 RepID=UPI00345E3B8F
MTGSQLGKSINQKIPQYFHQLPHHRYWLAVVHYHPDHRFNYFFYVKRLGVSTYSYPLGGEDDHLEKLKETLSAFRSRYQFPIQFINFDPETQRALQRWLHHLK